MLETNPDSVIQVLGAVALAVIVVFVSVQKLIKDWRSNSAEGSVISLMHTELERMAEQNTQLSVELGRLHSEVITLNQQLQKLNVENQQLRCEVVTLTQEVTRLQSVLNKGDLNGSTY
jgi:chromosome segregation ATPase